MLNEISQLETEIFNLSQELNKCVLCRTTLMELRWQQQSEASRIQDRLHYLSTKALLNNSELQEIEALNDRLRQILIDYYYVDKSLENDTSIALIKKQNQQLRKLESALKAAQHLLLTA